MSHRMVLRSILAAVSTSLVCLPAYAESWPKEAAFSCSDPLNLRPYLEATLAAQRPFSIVITKPTQGLGYAKASLSEYSRGLSGLAFAERTLAVDTAQGLKKRISASAANASIPASAQAAIGLLTGYGTSAHTSAAMGVVFTFLFDAAGTRAVEIRLLHEVVAEGGHIARLLHTGTRADNAHYLVESYEYSVQVGIESRHYVLASCAFALNLDVQTFETRAPVNNKRLFKQNTVWWIQDVSSNEKETQLSEYQRDKEYIYFIAANVFESRYRVSLHGGEMQRQGEDETWTKLYDKVVATN